MRRTRLKNREEMERAGEEVERTDEGGGVKYAFSEHRRRWRVGSTVRVIERGEYREE